MWLIADSGSTKTEWILFNNEGIKKKFFSVGLNPLFFTKKTFNTEVLNTFLANDRLEITNLWFYSAGCGSKSIKNKTKLWLAQVFKKATIAVDSDLLAAARATSGTNQGLIAILGTGSNSGFFDGNLIKAQIKPLGFILGDEGSGASLGKAILKKLLRNQFAPGLTKSIYQKIGLNYDEIIAKVYHSKQTSRFLASFVKVLHIYKSNKEMEQVIETEFNLFAGLLKMYNVKKPVYIIGSVAFYFEKEIRNSLQKNGLKIGKIIKAPAKALVNYHLKNS